MAYGLNPGLFLENGPALQAAQQRNSRSSTVYRAWRGLDQDRRLAVIERALKPANDDGVDGYPLAL